MYANIMALCLFVRSFKDKWLFCIRIRHFQHCFKCWDCPVYMIYVYIFMGYASLKGMRNRQCILLVGVIFPLSLFLKVTGMWQIMNPRIWTNVGGLRACGNRGEVGDIANFTTGNFFCITGWWCKTVVWISLIVEGIDTNDAFTCRTQRNIFYNLYWGGKVDWGKASLMKNVLCKTFHDFHKN